MRPDAGSSSFWQDRPVFVTGASGLIGGWLVKQLARAGRRCGLSGARLGAAV